MSARCTVARLMRRAGLGGVVRGNVVWTTIGKCGCALSIDLGKSPIQSATAKPKAVKQATHKYSCFASPPNQPAQLTVTLSEPQTCQHNLGDLSLSCDATLMVKCK
jgi:hypothetical protein